MRRVWSLFDGRDDTFATCAFRGTWAYPDNAVPTLCPECTTSNEFISPPLVIEWLPGSEKIASFHWPGFCTIVQVEVFDELKKSYPEVTCRSVEMVQDPKLKRPKKPVNKSKPRVWLPYDGPELTELVINNRVKIEQSSSLQIARTCSACGQKKYKLSGVESSVLSWDNVIKKPIVVRQPRQPGMGIFVRELDIWGNHIFGINELPQICLCTDEIREFVRERGYTNIQFLEYGEIVP